jgi:excisionase family DNA binding protein
MQTTNSSSQERTAARDVTEPRRLALSIEEAARQTGLGRSTFYELMQTGQLAYTKIGARRLILVADLEALLAAHRCVDTRAA